MTVTQMQATIKATKEFLNSSISKKTGIKKAKQKGIETLKTRFSTDISDISYEEAETLMNFFNDKEVNGITNFIPGSDVLAVIEEAREKQNDYETFYSQMQSIIQWNRGYNIETIVRKIYTKYVYRGSNNVDEIELLYSNVIELVNNANSENDLQEIESIIENLMSEGKIDTKEYNYLINIINDKRKEFKYDIL